MAKKIDANNNCLFKKVYQKMFDIKEKRFSCNFIFFIKIDGQD